ncbi:hypothetical protein NW759_003887 [Fusarium solani]|nr:hypothetical protein NW759_003887 [Fusarium solani]
MRDAEVNEGERTESSLVRQGIRREANRAYGHPNVVEGTTLGQLADALLEDLDTLRRQEDQERPVLFVAHSVGGIVVKMALVKASRNPKYEGIWRICYGIAFFGTPL